MERNDLRYWPYLRYFTYLSQVRSFVTILRLEKRLTHDTHIPNCSQLTHTWKIKRHFSVWGQIRGYAFSLLCIFLYIDESYINIEQKESLWLFVQDLQMQCNAPFQNA